MEGIVAFSLACNVMQTIHFGLETASVCKRFYEDKAPDSNVEYQCKELKEAVKRLQASSFPTPTTAMQDEERELQKIAQDLVTTAEGIKKEIDKCKSPNKQSLLRAVVNTSAYMVKRKARIEKLNRSLETSRTIMETRILICLRDKTEIIHQATQQGFCDIDLQLQHFLTHLQAGHTTLGQLIDSKSGHIKAVIHEEANRTIASLETQSKAVQHTVISEAVEMRLHMDQISDRDRSTQASEAQHKALLDSLYYPEMNARRNQSSINENDEKTFQWIFKDNLEISARWDGVKDTRGKKWDSFTAWLSSDDDIYWISGKAGSGKSSLIRFLTTKVETLKQWRPECRMISGFIWNAGTPLQRSQQGLFAALLYQLLETDAQARQCILTDSTISSKRHISDWSMLEMINCIVRGLESNPQPTCVFIDGLDEIDPEDFNGQHGLLTRLERLRTVTHVKFCLGSREEPVLSAYLNGFPRLRLEDLTRDAMEEFLAETLTTPLLKRLNHDQRRQLISMVVSRSDGVFLWVNLVAQSIRRGTITFDNWEQLQDRVEQLPTKLAELYHSMWMRLNPDDVKLYRAESALCFKLALGTFKSSSNDAHILLESRSSGGKGISLLSMLLCLDKKIRYRLLAGGSVNTEQSLHTKCEDLLKRLYSRCAGLLEVSYDKGDQSRILCASRRIVPIHRSVQEYLCNTTEGHQILAHSKHKSEDMYIILKLSNIISRLLDYELWSDVLLHPILAEAFPTPEIESKVIDVIFSFMSRSIEFNVPDASQPYSFLKMGAKAGSFHYVQQHLKSLAPKFSLPVDLLRSELLAWACSGLCMYSTVWSEHRVQQCLHLISFLLVESVDPNLPPPDLDSLGSGVGSMHTAFIKYLFSLLHIVTRLADSTSVQKQFLLCLFKFLMHGADTNRQYVLYIGKRGYWGACFGQRSIYRETDHGFTSFIVQMKSSCIFRTLCLRKMGRTGRLWNAMDWIETYAASEEQARVLKNFVNDTTGAPPNAVLSIQSFGTHHTFSTFPSSFDGIDALNETEQLEDRIGTKIYSKPQEWHWDNAEDRIGIVYWLRDQGYLPKDVDPERQANILRWGSALRRPMTLTFLDKMDWSYKPEYDNLLKALDDYHLSSENT